MNDENVENSLREIIAAHIKAEPDALARDATLESLNIESLDLIEIIFEIEERFDVNLEADEKTAGLSNLGDFIDWLQKNIEAEQLRSKSS